MDNETLIAMFIFILLAVGTVLVFLTARDEGYKKGQVDAINGEIKYKLVEFKDGSRGYYKEEDLKNLDEHVVIK